MVLQLYIQNCLCTWMGIRNIAKEKYARPKFRLAKKESSNFSKQNGRGDGVAESDSERAEELIGQYNDAVNKTEYKQVQLS